MSVIRTITLLCLSLLAGTHRADASGTTLAAGTAGTTRWEVISPLNFVPPAGFIPVTITATNSDSKALKLDYSYKSRDSFYPANTATVASGSLDIPALETASATHWIWRGSNFQRAESTSVIGITVQTPAGASQDSLRGSDRESGSSLAFSRASLASGDISPGRPDQFVYTPRGVEVAVLDLVSLPADWRVFSSLYALYLTPTDWDVLSPAVRDAMRTWIGFGGVVGIVDERRTEAQRVADALSPPGAGVGFFASEGAVTALTPGELEKHISEVAEFTTAFAVGVPATELDKRASSRRGRYKNRSGWRNRAGGKNQSFPLRDSFGRREIPYFAICMLLFVFAVLVGPVSLRLWAGPGKRHRLFLTTPIFSIAASGLLLLVVLLQDGMGIRGRRFTVIDLARADSPQVQALVYQEQFARAGMISGGGFPIEHGLMPIIPVETAETSLTVRDDRAVGPWLSSRRDSSIALVGTVPIRWKISQQEVSDNSMRLQIESPVSRFEDAWYVDGDGLVWKWDGRAGGDPGSMYFIPASRDARSVMQPMFDRCSTSLRKSMLKRVGNPGQRNRFWALAKDGAPAARPSHPKIKWLESRLILTSRVSPAN